MKTLFIGIDISLKSFMVAFLDQTSQLRCKPFLLSNTIEGAKILESRLLQLVKADGFQSLRLGVESTSFYGFHLLEYLSLSVPLTEARLLCYQLDPRRVKHFKKILSENHKNDIQDAIVIAKFVRLAEELPQAYEGNATYLPLRRLVRYRYHLVKSIVRETQYFISNLFLQFPGWLQHKPIASVNQAAASLLLRDLTPDEVLHMSNEDLISVVAKAGRDRSPDPGKIAQAIQLAAKESFQLRPALADSVSLVLSLTRQNIDALKNSVKEVDKAIREESRGFTEPLLSVPGLGPVFSAGIAASIGNIHRYPDDDAIAKKAGLVWKDNQSGLFEADEKRPFITGDRYLRYYLVEAANSLRVHNSEYIDYYHKKYHEVTKHPHKRALVLTARKLVRLVFALLSKNQSYSPTHAYQSAGLGAV